MTFISNYFHWVLMQNFHRYTRTHPVYCCRYYYNKHKIMRINIVFSSVKNWFSCFAQVEFLLIPVFRGVFHSIFHSFVLEWLRLVRTLRWSEKENFDFVFAFRFKDDKVTRRGTKGEMLMNRDLDVYLNQLRRAKIVCERCITERGGESYLIMDSGVNKESLSNRKVKKSFRIDLVEERKIVFCFVVQIINLKLILSSIKGRHYFHQFLETFGTQSLIRFEKTFCLEKQNWIGCFYFVADFGTKFGNSSHVSSSFEWCRKLRTEVPRRTDYGRTIQSYECASVYEPSNVVFWDEFICGPWSIYLFSCENWWDCRNASCPHRLC